MTPECRCFWWEDDFCVLGEEPVQETCPHHRIRTDPETGAPWPPVNWPPMALAEEDNL